MRGPFGVEICLNELSMDGGDELAGRLTGCAVHSMVALPSNEETRCVIVQALKNHGSLLGVDTAEHGELARFPCCADEQVPLF